MKTKISWVIYCLMSLVLLQPLSAAERFVANEGSGFVWIRQGKAYPILIDPQEDKGVVRAVVNLQTDAGKVTGVTPEIINSASGKRMLIVGSIENSSWIKQLLQSGKINAADLQGKREKYILQTVKNPIGGVEEAVGDCRVVINVVLFMAFMNLPGRWEYLPGISGRMYR